MSSSTGAHRYITAFIILTDRGRFEMSRGLLDSTAVRSVSRRGYKHLADDHCLPCPSSDKEDDCMYCPWASIEEDEAAEQSTTATLGADSAAPGSGRDQSPMNDSPPLPGSSGSCWTPVANTRTYTPVPEDTDRILCVKNVGLYMLHTKLSERPRSV
ncbi:hypothetical protein Pmar_PMAR024676 [Perkinsus marinus ATCC 50983]|uniref:Uncharacterized protein n=1 Tax=Perkinsus marinus (strain ATCC 50983 / TXsc) TaxID=423536 RepID=C5M1B5_PERM5|nr:hypothetical protein Pmar_PMAR024676 [Perkinsus marinus ATCC 50983]EEQ97237.1 hypothetical protein Pmar_PMAR024676 [Perkinsus marinus ATCC 50983]|eukprot:XP_002764520.1 hypothetical protein Pmar_PMAR024676 [Perkinsus marinus ATCC 50983]